VNFQHNNIITEVFPEFNIFSAFYYKIVYKSAFSDLSERKCGVPADTLYSARRESIHDMLYMTEKTVRLMTPFTAGLRSYSAGFAARPTFSVKR